jgi:hypothetical protein
MRIAASTNSKADTANTLNTPNQKKVDIRLPQTYACPASLVF